MPVFDPKSPIFDHISYTPNLHFHKNPPKSPVFNLEIAFLINFNIYICAWFP